MKPGHRHEKDQKLVSIHKHRGLICYASLDIDFICGDYRD